MHQFSTLWLCCAPKREPPPLAVRMTIGTEICPPVMYRALATSLAIMSKQTAMKSENMISAMVGIPVIAAPAAAPMMACSEIGVSRTRSGPNSSSRPTVVLNTPPASAMSSPSITSMGSRRISWAIPCATASR
jgi:hypothetical protein